MWREEEKDTKELIHLTNEETEGQVRWSLSEEVRTRSTPERRKGTAWGAQGPALRRSDWEAPRSREKALSVQEWELHSVGGRLTLPSNDQRIPALSDVEVVSSAPAFHGRGNQESVRLAQGMTWGRGQLKGWLAAPEAQEGLARFLVGHSRCCREGEPGCGVTTACPLHLQATLFWVYLLSMVSRQQKKPGWGRIQEKRLPWMKIQSLLRDPAFNLALQPFIISTEVSAIQVSGWNCQSRLIQTDS